MDNVLSKLLIILLLLILLCVVPAFYINMYYDFSNYNSKVNEVNFFLDKAIIKGKIIEDKNLYDSNLEIFINRDIYMPIYNESKNLVYTKHSILEKIKSEGVFKLNVGDIVTVIWHNKKINSNIFLKNIFGTNIKNITIKFSGVVKNECI